MELMYPKAIYIAAAVVLILIFVGRRKHDKYKKGTKAANADLIYENEYYKKLMVRYNILKVLAVILSLASIAVAILILTRPHEVSTTVETRENRDVFLTMDVSTTMDELNLELIDGFIDMVKELNGERVGITIFNAKSVLLVPLTTDYDYVCQTLEYLKESIAMYEEDNDSDYYKYWYRFEGTLMTGGSSLIGDGLAATVYDFDEIEEDPDRTRIIIFSTDNDLAGIPISTVDEACEMCRDKNILVYAIAPDTLVDESNYREAIESTGGNYYPDADHDVVKDLVDDIEETDSTIIVNEITRVTDKPQMLIILLIILVTADFIVLKRLKA